jgi:IS1 family transposase
MAEIICKGCGASDYVKNGYVRGLQRYRCKECGCNFTATAPRGKPAAMKALALLLYAMANVSFCSIARLLKVSDVAVLKWVRAEARKLPEPEPSGHIAIVTLDEMWHFLKKRAYDPVQQRTIAWVLGDRDDATCQRLLDKIGMAGRQFITDDWEGYHRLIPEDQLFTGKDLTFSIEQDNSNIRHFIARFRRRTKVVSKVEEMVDLSLRLYHFLHDNPKNFAALAFTFLSIFS